MRLNWLGKAFLGAAGAAVVGKLYENATEGVRAADFSDDSISMMLDAVRDRDFARFAAVFRSTRPGASDSDVLTGWQHCVQYITDNG